MSPTNGRNRVRSLRTASTKKVNRYATCTSETANTDFPATHRGRSAQDQRAAAPHAEAAERYLDLSQPDHPGTTVDLPNFITADFTLELIALKGLGTYPFSDLPSLSHRA